MSCGFGQVPDLRASSLCLNGKVIIDPKRNITGKNIKAQNITIINTFTTKGNVCSECTVTSKVTPKSTGGGLVLEEPMLFGRYGFGRVHLTDKYVLEDTDFTMIDSEDWDVDHESSFPGTSLFKQNENLFTLPTELPTLGTQWSAYVEVDVSLNVLMYDFVPFLDSSESETLSILLLKNGDDPESMVSSSSTTNSITEAPQLKTMHFKDTIRCSPGDVLNIGLYQESDEGESMISDYLFYEGMSNYANFKIIGFDKFVEDPM
jgi:hypothetical protein